MPGETRKTGDVRLPDMASPQLCVKTRLHRVNIRMCGPPKDRPSI